nr:MAG TPA: hypothetical protein [Caudoviricetes sp.]
MLSDKRCVYANYQNTDSINLKFLLRDINKILNITIYF